MARRSIACLLSAVLLFCLIAAIPAEQVDAAEENELGIIEVQDKPESAAIASEQLDDLFTTIDLMDATISDLQEEMAAGHVTSAQLTQMYIDRIEAYDEKLKLNSIISINPNALSDAAALDRERSEGHVRGPMHGIPIVVKANYDVAGMATSAGSNALAFMVSPTDAFTVKKLKDAGAVILAHANMSEFAASASNSRSTLGGFVHNAYDGSKTPAGSSGGTAVAVTCNFAAAGLGTDTGGSIRNPSSFSNLYGIRPSKGLTSISGVVPLIAQRDTTGPMARTAEDLALVLQTMAGTDPDDDFTQEADADALVGNGYMDALSDKPGSLKGLRIGYMDYSFITKDQDEKGEIVTVEPDEKIRAMLNKTRANLRKAGVEFVDASEYLSIETVYGCMLAAADDTTEYDTNKYLHEKGDAAPYKTFKELYLSGADVMYTNLMLPEGKTADDLADSFEETENPYTLPIGPYLRGPWWDKSPENEVQQGNLIASGSESGEEPPIKQHGTLDGRAMISNIMKEHDIDAVMYLNFFDAPPDQSLPKAAVNNANYVYIFGPGLGLPEISLPMGFSDANGEYTSEMPLGLSIFADFGDEETLMKIAYAYEQQAGEFIRKMPERTPPLADVSLNAYLEDLMEKVHSIDYSDYNSKPAGRVQLMLNAYDKARSVNTDDPNATYKATKNLARAYDRVMISLESSKYNMSKATVSGLKTKTYTGKKLTQSPIVRFNGKTLKPEVDYTMAYAKNVNAGTATLIITGTGDYAGTKSATFKINKAKQPMTAKATNKTVKYKQLKQKAVSFAKMVTVKKQQGTLAFKNVSKQSAAKRFKVNVKNGKVTIPKSTKKGFYKVRIKVTANGTKNYKAGSKTIAAKVVVK